MKKFYAIPFIVCLIFFQNITIHSQTSITGKVTDKETGEEMIAANIMVSQEGVFVAGKSADIDGNYTIQVDPGIYDMEVSYTGYPNQKITEIMVYKGQTTKIDVQMNLDRNIIDWCLGCWSYYKIPLIKQDETSTGVTIETEKIRNLPTRNINKISTITPGVSFNQ